MRVCNLLSVFFRRTNEVDRLKILDIEAALKGGNFGNGGNDVGGANGASGSGGGGGSELGRLGTPAFINIPETNSLKAEEIEEVSKEIKTLNSEQVNKYCTFLVILNHVHGKFLHLSYCLFA